jgi:hypothetical protein
MTSPQACADILAVDMTPAQIQTICELYGYKIIWITPSADKFGIRPHGWGILIRHVSDHEMIDENGVIHLLQARGETDKRIWFTSLLDLTHKIKML